MNAMKQEKKINFSPPQTLSLVFLAFIVLGTLLLKLPGATVDSITWLDSLFTATSAMTVTGLIVMSTGGDFTTFGEVVILCLIQIGGLGIMTFAMLIFILLGRKIGVKQRLIVQQALNQTSIGGVIRLVKRIFLISIGFEMIGFIFLSLRWVPELGWADGMYASLFHAISAFNNAGFSIWDNSLMDWVGDPVVNVVITLLFMTGGIGFTVLVDLWYTRTFHGLKLHTKLMVVGTLAINVFAMFVIFILEYNNPDTLGGLSTGRKLLGSYFQAVTPRTAGFNTLDTGSMDEATLFFTIILMFIGAGSASTGGGIKLTSFLAMLASVITFLKNKQHIVIAERTLRNEIVIKALAISIISFLFVSVAIFILNITEKAPFLMTVFEAVSAFGTVGLSMGLTAELSAIGKIVIIFLMFLGKIGPLTLAFSLASPGRAYFRYPKEDILTG
jgi:trk system potassium uptake protein TrkH